MKHRVALLAAVALCASATLHAQVEEVRLPDGKVVKIDRSVFPTLQHDAERPAPPAAYVAHRKARAEGREAAIQLPPYVYNGLDKYFPPIFNQDGGSCGSAQNIGYIFTHEIDCARDLDASLPENQYPTHFTWLLSSQNSEKEFMAMGNGIPNVVTYGGRTYSRLFGSQSPDDPDYGWMQGYDKWYSAMCNRAQRLFSMSPTHTPEGRRELKEWLYNHGGDTSLPSGGLVGIGVAGYGTWAAIPSSAANQQAGVVGMKYVKSWGDTFNHGVTICGYDDRIEFDLDGDGKVGEKDEDEVGAWIIANSWGDGWENKGFIYCPYKYSFAVGTDSWEWTPDTYTIRRGYRPLRTIKLLMEYSHRSELWLSAGVSQDLDATEPDYTVDFEHFKFAGNGGGVSPTPATPMLGRWTDGMHYEPMEFGYDLTDLTATVDRTKAVKYFFIIKTRSGAVGTGTLHTASIVNYEIENDGLEIPFPDQEVTIQNGGRQTVVTVIVPGEQLYPATNLTLSGDQLTWTVPQPSSLTLTGYHVYDGELLLAEVPATQTSCALGDACGPLTVCAVYQAGKYGQESAPTNAVAVELPQTDHNGVVTLDGSGFTIPEVLSKAQEQVTMEFWMRCEKNANYIQQIGPGWGKFLFHVDASGTLSVGWENNGSDRLNIPSVFTSTTKWNHIAIVIDGSVLTVYVNGLRKGQIKSRTFHGLAGFGDLLFGHRSSNNWWQGSLDEVRIWRTARTALQIKSNMRIPIAQPSAQPDLLAYLPMDTIVINGRTYLRDWAAGHHATLHASGPWKVQQDGQPFVGTKTAPAVEIVDDGTPHVCGLPFQLAADASLNATSWQWQMTAATGTVTCQGPRPTFLLSDAGTHTVTCTVTFPGYDPVTATRDITLAEGTPPVAAFDIVASELPATERFSFINRSQGDGCTYQWTMPGAELETAQGTNATALYVSTGTFPVTLTATNSCGTSSVTHQVHVFDSAPRALFDISDGVIILGDTVQLVDHSRYNPDAWQWTLNNHSRAFLVDGPSPAIVPTAPGIYDVSLRVTNALGRHELTRNRLLTVCNADARTCLNFTGTERLTLASPFADEMKTLTLEWWMRPQQYAGSVALSAQAAGLTADVDDHGKVTIQLGDKSATSADGFVVLNEWHHYAITYTIGSVKFYRDTQLVSTSPTRLANRMPPLGTITVGKAVDGLRGQLDEVRLWGIVMTEDDLKAVCNAPLAAIADHESERQLLLYYDFNQNGGAVQDRTSHGHHAQRVNSGPDGDAWNSSNGVFALDVQAETAGDITDRYLTNYQNPFQTIPGTVNSNDPSRFLRFAMKTTRSKWQDANAVAQGALITGAHIDTKHGSDLTIETSNNHFATELRDYRLWHPVTLPAGRYAFSVTFGDGSDAQTSRLVVCEGRKMVSDADCEQQALAWCTLTDKRLEFELDDDMEVSLGLIVNMQDYSTICIHAFRLEGVAYTRLAPVETDDTALTPPLQPAAIHPEGYYNLQGERVAAPLRGIYIHDGRKVLVP